MSSNYVNKFNNKFYTLPLNGSKFLSILKSLGLAGILSVAIAELVLNLQNSELTLPCYVATPIIYMIAFLFYAINEYFSYQANQKRNGCLWLFWLITSVLYLLNLLANLIPYLEQNQTDFQPSVIAICYFCLSLIILVFNSLPESTNRKQVSAKNLIDEKNDTQMTSSINSKLPNPTKINPELYVGYPSVLGFSWFTQMVRLGHRKSLEIVDLWKLNIVDTTKTTSKKFLAHYRLPSFFEYNFKDNLNKNLNVNQSKFNQSFEDISIYKALMKTYGPLFLSASCFKLGNDFLQFLNPIFLNLMIEFISDPTQPDWIGYVYAVLMFLGAITVTLCLHQYFHRVFRIGMNMRSSLISLIYQKALKLNAEARGATSVGELVTYMSTDTQRLADTMPYFAQIWSSPLQIIICMVLLYNQLGWSAFVGLGTSVILIPLNMWAQGLVRKATMANIQLRSKRVKKTTEMLNGMKIMKLYSWEESFKNAINVIRDQELVKYWVIAKLGVLFSVLWGCAPVFISLAAFASYIYTGTEENPHVLTSSKTFVSVSLFNILRFPLNVLPGIIVSIVQANVSVKRIDKYLKSGELDPKTIQRDLNRSSNDKKLAVKIENCSFSWNNLKNDNLAMLSEVDDQVKAEKQAKDAELEKKSKSTFQLKDINLEVQDGELVAIIGMVGSGKSSLVQSLLGDLYKISGQVAEVYGRISYVAQQAWIMNMTLKENILFNNPYDEDKYHQALKSCALIDDIDMLPSGDSTEIGEKGINLSGGQKQRVALARSVYQEADTFIFDDPLSAVDNHVGKHIFEQVLSNEKGLLKGKTRILVTNAMQYVSLCDKVVIIDDGKIIHSGTYVELMTNQDAKDRMDKFGVKEEDKEDSPRNTKKQAVQKRKSVGVSDEEKLLKNKEKAEAAKTKGVLVQKEGLEEGNVSWQVFKNYFKSVTYYRLFWIVATNVIYIGANSGGRIWLSEWSNASDQAEVEGSVLSTSENTKYISIYAAFGISQVISVCFRTLALYWGSINASRKLHANLISNVVRLPMSFFDTTPLGRIINRFAKDIATVDDVLQEGSFITSLSLSRSLGFWLPGLFDVLVTIIICTYATPWFIAVIIPLLIVYFFFQRYFIATSRQLKRLESVTRSPIYNNFSETLGGTSTIRAFNKVEEFYAYNEKIVDTNQACYYPNISSNRWLAIRLEIIANTIVLAESVFATLARNSLSASIVGLSISYAMSITQTLNWWVRQTSEIEANIVSVERIKEYTDEPQEAPAYSPDHTSKGNATIAIYGKNDLQLKAPSPDWPSKGKIEFRNYSTRYRKGLDNVVNNINFTIQPGEKVGIVGRTGAGKSSLTLALFRIIEASEGQIIIDDEDTSKMGLTELRSKLTIIPQDPFLFSGSLRYNLDPVNTDKHDDETLWRALERSGNMKEYISKQEKKLDHEVSENGSNFSAGQSQLLCLARALIRESKILVLDEATAAVDPKTDLSIQETIRNEFKDWTILTIAHRINTILDYDKILVLDKGQISEYDSPEKLLENPNGIFYSLCDQAGLIDNKKTV